MPLYIFHPILMKYHYVDMIFGVKIVFRAPEFIRIINNTAIQSIF